MAEKSTVSVHLCCYNKILEAKFRQFIMNRNVFLVDLETRGPRSKSWQVCVWLKSAPHKQFLLYGLTGQNNKKDKRKHCVHTKQKRRKGANPLPQGFC